MKAVILAAGEGTRLNKGWTIVPKPLLEVGSKTIIEHAISSLKEAGIKDFLIVTGFMSEHIKDYLRDGFELGVNIEYVYNKDYKSSLLNSLRLVKEKVEGSFVLCMADLFFPGSIVKDLVHNSTSYHNYVCVDKKLSKIRRIEEKYKVQTMNDNILQVSHVLPTYNAIDCGIYLMQDSIFPIMENCLEQGKNSLPLIITELAIQGKFRAHDIGDSEVIDIDREKDVEYIQNEVLRNANKERSSDWRQ